MTDRPNKTKAATTVIVLAGLVQLANPLGPVTGRPAEVLAAEEGAAPSKHVEDLAGKFGRYYKPVRADVKPSVPPYALPLAPQKVSNWSAVAGRLRLSKRAQAMLQANGFVVVPMPEGLKDEHHKPLPLDDIIKPYEGLKEANVPAFVTTDTLLHLYHVQFDESLKDIEQREFYPDLRALAKAMVADLGKAHASHKGAAIEKDALGKAWTFAAVGCRCLSPDWQPPGAIGDDVAEVLKRIDKHEGFWPPPATAHTQWPLFRYAEDFSQYVPRGHYTRSEELKRYFRAMMWFGRMSFLLKGGEPYGAGDAPFLVSRAEAHTQTLAAAHMVRWLATATLADGRPAAGIWRRIYTVTAFYVGLADDLGLEEYEAALWDVVGAARNVSALAREESWRKVQVELAKYSPPAIYSGTGKQSTLRGRDPRKLLEVLDKSTGFRFMGQRFIPDSYLMGRLVFPTVGRWRGGRDELPFTAAQTQTGIHRVFPRGLDVMAVLGSERARHWLKELGDDAYGAGIAGAERNLRYDVVLAEMKRQFDGFSAADWNRNIYWSWLYALQPLLKPYGRGYPTFMTTDAWADRSLTTALASWAQLRHDTILYAKQSYTMEDEGMAMPPAKPIPGLVEPAAQFYARLLATTRLTLAGLKEMKVLQPQAVQRLQALERILDRLLKISRQQLAHRPLDRRDVWYVREFAGVLGGLRVRDPALQEALREARRKGDRQTARRLQAELYGEKSMKTTIIADVHTDQNTRKVLEEGTGQVDLVVVCYRLPDGRLALGAGPALSYYEFKHPMADRLTDEKWRKMLQAGQAPPRPKWTAAFFTDK